VLELVLTDESVTPRVELLDGPRVRLTMSASESLAHSIEFCRSDLAQAVEAALNQLHEDESATARIFVRDDSGSQIITTIDPCATYGSEAIVRA
jgi:DNA-binding TFAR19-related protein (PDSD5 family)